jgi:hypothetical protein
MLVIVLLVVGGAGYWYFADGVRRRFAQAGRSSAPKFS